MLILNHIKMRKKIINIIRANINNYTNKTFIGKLRRIIKKLLGFGPSRYQEWTIEDLDNDVLDLDVTLNGELIYRKNLCKKSIQNYNNYINYESSKKSKDFSNSSKTASLVIGDLRSYESFSSWMCKIEKTSKIFIYTNKSTYSKIPELFRKIIEKNAIDLKFAEEDNEYINICTTKKVERGIHKFLKLNRAINYWKQQWIDNNIETIFTLRSDIGFLNPFLLENAIKDGFKYYVNKGTIISRSDLIYAFNIGDIDIFYNFINKIFSFYLNEDWIKYPFKPIHPNYIIQSKGGVRIEWNKYPIKYVGINPNKYNFFERFSSNYDLALDDFNKSEELKNMGASEREALFGKLTSTRFQSYKSFASERNFADYLLRNGLFARNSNELFSGPLLRN